MSGPSPTSDTSFANYVHEQRFTTALLGKTSKKRPREQDEVDRPYQCSWPSCSKAYPTLNHLNAHITMQKHGPQRNPSEFKHLRKIWRKRRKEA
ncbi:hypothetical protein MD484_g2228, partial [Candolleomyces efflorescens]